MVLACGMPLSRIDLAHRGPANGVESSSQVTKRSALPVSRGALRQHHAAQEAPVSAQLMQGCASILSYETAGLARTAAHRSARRSYGASMTSSAGGSSCRLAADPMLLQALAHQSHTSAGPNPVEVCQERSAQLLRPRYVPPTHASVLMLDIK